MNILATVLVILIAILHFYIMILEMYLFDTPRVIKMFNITEKLAHDAKVLAANQGAYNGVLALGLLVGLFLNNNGLVVYILLAIVLLALYGGFTASKSIIIKQGLPTFLTLVIYVLSM